MYNEMGWKMRKDKLQSDEPDTEAPQDQYEQDQEQTPEIEADASAMARLAQLSADIEPSAFVLDLDKDSFRTDTTRTSLDPNQFGWFNDSKPDVSAPKAAPQQPTSRSFDAPSLESPAFNTQPQSKTPSYSEPAFDAEPSFDLQSPTFKPAEQEPPISWNGSRTSEEPAWAQQSTPSPAFDEPAPTPTPIAPEPPAWAAPQPSWAQEAAPQAPPPAFADPTAGQVSAPFTPAPSQNGHPAPQQAPYQPASQAPFAPISESPAPGPFSDPAPSAESAYQPQQQSPFQPAPQQAPKAPPPAAPRSPYANTPPAIQQSSPYASQPARNAGDGQNINSFSRESVAPGLVTGEGDFSIPKVAPFIVAGSAPAPDETPVSSGDHYLILRIRNLSSSYKLTKDITTIGRPDSITKNYPDVEIEIDDGVSRKHAEIRRKNGEFYVVDVGSTNGTLLNGDLMDVNVEMKLAHGDRIRVGEKTEIVFE